MYTLHYFYATSFFLAVLLFLSACSVGKSGVRLTDENIQSYLKAYSQLRNQAPDMLEAINNDPDNTEKAGQEQYEVVEEIIQGSGLTDYAEFATLNAKIGSVFTIIQAESGMTKFENLQDSSNSMLDEGIAELQKNLNDPDVPEETKEELRITLKELEKGKKELNESYSKNLKMANFVMDQVKNVSGFIVDKEEVELVKKYEKQILEVYVGFPLPYESDGRLPKLNL